MKKKILIIDQGAAFGGSLVVAGLLADNLRQRDFEVHVAVQFVNAFTKRIFSSAEDVYKCHNPMPYARLARLRARVNALHRLSILRPLFHRALSVLDCLGSLCFSAELALLIIRKRIDVVHVNNALEGIYAGLLTRRPVVYHMHGDIRVLARIHRVAMNRCSTVVSISRVVSQWAGEYGIRAEKIQLVPNGTELHNSAPSEVGAIRKYYRIPDDAKLVALVGRIVPWKGHAEFLESAIEVHRRMPATHFMFVGDTSDGTPEFLDGLMQAARKAGLAPYLHCTGYVSNVLAHIEASDILVHASIEPEPFGLVLIEGMAMGRPVIASTLGAGPEIVTQGVDGLLVDPRSKSALTDAICTLLTDPHLAKVLSAAAKRTVERKFSAAAMARQFERIYQNVLAH